ncbi:multisubunit sodium/proton antiporter, MrpE subunit [Anaerolinea thermolimosa]|uniref:Na+/H+ antiporter subunit E n=1 Tax=Anaerolinea thermolimosa TaxID=229919 RepID=UPI000AF24A33|nr:Na+/H+ antiporter subunit E [Anaerolinea thermolimosa]GAP08114.1 multisubunit sodium/proton antiporter, MrpE subunit [Anaerolinea thermolimosa]
MTIFLLNVLLAVAWGALIGDFSPINLAFGFALSYLTLWVVLKERQRPAYFRRFPLAIEFIFFFLKELTLANLRMARTVLAPRLPLRPAVVSIPVELQSDAAIALLMNLLTLTPGTLSLDISGDRKTLFVHTVWLENEEDFRREIKEGFERRVRELFE